MKQPSAPAKTADRGGPMSPDLSRGLAMLKQPNNAKVRAIWQDLLRHLFDDRVVTWNGLDEKYKIILRPVLKQVLADKKNFDLKPTGLYEAMSQWQ